MREVCAMLAKECKPGVTWVLEPRGKHQAILLTVPNRPREMITVSRTPSDHRALMNIRGDVRRALRRLAVI